ncbi:hypothetical protein PAP18089_01415 [Pandoraea apista]|uniref:Uncharacterized protein n=1 Tax=Pandoraea apista TaxID=93218 RepID=A0A5E5P2F6_9BURK|nr:hypothetical protein PAP18089_01415 [Pandoraea apista]
MTHKEDEQDHGARARPDAARAEEQGERERNVATLRSTLAPPVGRFGLCVGERRTGEQRTFSTTPEPRDHRATLDTTADGQPARRCSAALRSSAVVVAVSGAPAGCFAQRSERPSALDGSSAAFHALPGHPGRSWSRGLRRLSVSSTVVASIAISGRIACPRRFAAPPSRGTPPVRSSTRPASSRPARRACGPGLRC